MKNFYLFILASTMMLFSACHDRIWDAIDDLDSRVAKLEELCKEMNTNISSLQTIVSVLQENDYITGIVPIEKGGKIVGYTISFKKHQPITIYNGTDGKDGLNGMNGQDGYTPILGVAQGSDGVYYWTLDGKWLLDEDGNKFRVTGRDGKDGQDGKDGVDGKDGQDGKDGVDGKDGQDGKDGVDGENGKDGADGKDGQDGTNGTNGVDGKDGVTPQLKIENNYWYISYDNGVTWTELGKAVGADGKDGINGSNGKDGQDGDSMFSTVTYDEKNAYLTLADGTVLTIPLGDGVWEKLEDLEERIAKLEALCKEMNTNIVSLQTIVAALQENDWITGVAPIAKDGKTIGYVISFAKNDPITIYNGEDGKDGVSGTNGVDGKDGYTPILGVAKDTDDVYYWTLDGQWLLDVDGKKLRVTGRDGKDGEDGVDGEDGKDGENGKDGVDGEDGKDGQNGQNGQNGTNGVDGKDGVTPQLKIENNYWYVSYDKGATWTKLGKAVGEDGKDGIDGEDGKDGQDGKPGAEGQPGKDGVDGDSMFSNVTFDENNVYFLLTNGTTLVVPRGNSSTSDFDQTLIDNVVSSLELDKDTIYLFVGEKSTIIATTLPFANSKVIWSSSDNTKVKVKDGMIEAFSVGEVIITAKAGTLIKYCYVNVIEKVVVREYVDLGLSVKWATCNVGANSPEEYGDYFAWGETTSKDEYNWNYKYCKGSGTTFTKYCNKSSSGYNGFTDTKTKLDPDDDAATVNWGGSWRMPTVAEMTELQSECTWIWVIQNGVNGYKVVGKNGNSIFLPATGAIFEGSAINGAGEIGVYWSSSLNVGGDAWADGPSYAYEIAFVSDNVVSGNLGSRNKGQVVRPVCP